MPLGPCLRVICRYDGIYCPKISPVPGRVVDNFPFWRCSPAFVRAPRGSFLMPTVPELHAVSTRAQGPRNAFQAHCNLTTCLDIIAKVDTRGPNLPLVAEMDLSRRKSCRWILRLVRNNMLFHAVATLAAILPLLCAEKVISLVGDDWTLSNDALNISVPAHLPSQAHLDLYAADVIGDPYFDLNDFNLRWVVWNNWTYTSAPISGLSYDASSTWLQFNGLDTFATISFCGKHVASTNNQFRQWWFDVSDLLSSCSENSRVLSINFGSAPTIANEIANEPGQETWPFGVQQLYEFNNRWFIRKVQSNITPHFRDGSYLLGPGLGHLLITC